MALLKILGENPVGEDLIRIKTSPFYRSSGFENEEITKMMADDASISRIAWKFFFGSSKGLLPSKEIPTVRTDLNALSVIGNGHPVIVWFGHSSYLVHIDGLNILVDPVFSGHASPFAFTTRNFPGSNPYAVSDFPDIDLLILTHDHYDHLDYETVSQFAHKTKKVCTSLGVGAHLRYWGWDPEKITELSWGDSFTTESKIRIQAATARHFSGRSLHRNKTLWSSFILEVGAYRLYIGGDSGYGPHFKKIGEQYGPFDIVMLESGQYNKDWPNIHMMPEETVQAAIDLKAKMLLPVHWGKFRLSLHPWNEPIQRIAVAAPALGMPYTSPMIGEPVILDLSYPNKDWWRGY